MTTREPDPTSYALQRLFLRQIKLDWAIDAVLTGEVIERHRLGTERPSRLCRAEVEWTNEDGTTRTRVLHIACVEDPNGMTRILTGYWPDQRPEQWDADFRTRKA